MLKNQITIDETIDFLNDLIKTDKPALAALIANRVPCNRELAEHPTVQVAQQNDGFHVGMLGILNGLFGIHETGQGPIAFYFTDDGNLLKVGRTTLARREAGDSGENYQPEPESEQSES